MAKKATLTDVSSGYSSGVTLNDNFEALNDALDNTLSLDGSTPNAMGADLDMNSNDILNANSLDISDDITIRGTSVLDALGGAVTGSATIFNTVSRFNGDNSTVSYTLVKEPAAKANTLVYIDGIYQQKNTYSISGTTLTFSEAPVAGTNNIEVVTQEATDIGTIDPSAVDLPNGSSIQDAIGLHYNSRATLVTDVAAGDLSYLPNGTIVTDGTVSYIRNSSSTEISDLSGFDPFGRVQPQHWGFVADGTTGQETKFQEFVDYVKSNGILAYAPGGTYRLDSEIDWYYATDKDLGYGLEGDGPLITVFEGDIPVGDWMFKVSDDAQSDNLTNKIFRNFSFDRGSNWNDFTGPTGGWLDTRRLGNSTLENIRFGDNNGPQWRTSKAANLRLVNVDGYGGGYSFPIADTDLVTVSGTAATDTITATAGTPFTSDMVGLSIRVTTSSNTYVFTIATYSSSTVVTVNEDITSDFTGGTLEFTNALVSCNTGVSASTVTSDVDIFTANDVGLSFWIAGAKTDGGPQKVTISSFTNAGSVEVTPNVEQTVSDAEAVVFAWEVDDSMTAGASQTDIDNDVDFQNCTVHTPSGGGLIISDAVRIRGDGLKLHGSTGKGYEKVPGPAMWVDNVGIDHLRFWIGSSWGSQHLVRAFNIKDQDIVVDLTFTTGANFQYLYRVETQSGDGLLRDLGGGARLHDIDYLVSDANSPTRAVLDGVPRKYTAAIRDQSGNSNNLKATRFTRIGDQVTVVFQFNSNLDTSGLTAGDIVEFSLPYNAVENTFAPAIFESMTSGTAPFWLRTTASSDGARVFDTPVAGALQVSSINSGTSDFDGCTLTYFTEV